MLRRFSIDSLLLLLTLSVAFLVVAVNDKNLLLGISPEYKEEMRFDDQAVVEYDGWGIEAVHVSNPSLTLQYSVDGGDTWIESENPLDIRNVRMNYLLDKSTSPRWLPNDGNFPELKSVRVRVVDETRLWITEERVLTYFNPSGPEFRNDYFPIVSLNTSEKGLFDWNEGILVQGNASTFQDVYQQPWWDMPGNYQQRGIEWQRRVNFQLNVGPFDSQADCGLRVNGNATRGFPQKSLRLETSRIYGSEQITFFDQFSVVSPSHTSLILRNSGNDNTRTMFADLLIHRIFEPLEVVTQQGSPAHTFINGNYWGIFNIRHRIDENFLATELECKPEEVTILENGEAELKFGDQKDKSRFDQLIAALPSNEILSNVQLEKLKEDFDLESFIDYVLIETFVANQDWPHNNSTLYCENGKKWRWVLNDVDYSMAYPGEDNVNSNPFTKLSQGSDVVSTLFSALISNPDFKTAFQKRAEDLLATVLSERAIQSQFDFTKGVYDPEIDLTIRRWRAIKSRSQWEDDCAANLSFLLDRREIYRKQVKEL